MRVLVFGDIYAKPGRQAVAAALPELKAKYQPDILMANVENLAGGRGVNKKTLNEMWELGFHGLTSGNHIWDNREVFPIFEKETRLFRPANYPSPQGSDCPGQGYGLIKSDTAEVFVVNLMGRAFMDPVDCPFQSVDAALERCPKDVPILVDIHAETTSEKTAMGHYLDGKVTAVWGTHTHVQTADETILPQGTGYITDIGMSGSFLSCIGAEPREVINRLKTKRYFRYQTAESWPGVGCVVFDIEDRKVVKIERLRYRVNPNG